LSAGYPASRIYPHAAHQRHVQHQRAVGRGQAGDVVPPALDAQQQVVLARELHAGNHVGSAQAAGDRGGVLVDHCVPHGPGFLVADIAGEDHRAPQARLQAVEGLLLQVYLAAGNRRRFHGRGSCSLVEKACSDGMKSLLTRPPRPNVPALKLPRRPPERQGQWPIA
jgi:hypothetical protein